MPFPDTLSAGRRGFLMGIILAELMLITLFVLLLFLKNYQQTEQDLEQFGGRKPLSEAAKLGQLISESKTQRELSDIWTVLTREVEKQATSPGQLDSWLNDLEEKTEEAEQEKYDNERLREKVEELEDKLTETETGLEKEKERSSKAEDKVSELTKELDKARKDLDLLKDDSKLQQELEKLREELAKSETNLEKAKERNAELEQSASEQAEKLAESDNKMNILKDEIAKTKAGGLVLCMFERPASSAGKLRGKSVPLGTMHLEADGITLIQRNEEIRGMSVIDYVGDAFDTSRVLDLLYDWPLHTKLSFEEFGLRAKPFVRLGNQESEKRQNCRFSMNYYIEDFKTPFSVYNDQFQQYFLPQTDISRAEFERLRR